MKMKMITLIAVLGTPFALAAEKDHDHSKESKKEHADHDHDDDDHDDEKKGPNGGRLITSVTPTVEVITGKDRKLRIVFLDADKKPVAPGAQVITAAAGERANPTRLTFAKGEGEDAEVLVADKPLPDGAHVQLIIQIKVTPDAKTVTERFELHLH